MCWGSSFLFCAVVVLVVMGESGVVDMAGARGDGRFLPSPPGRPRLLNLPPAFDVGGGGLTTPFVAAGELVVVDVADVKVRLARSGSSSDLRRRVAGDADRWWLSRCVG